MVNVTRFAVFKSPAFEWLHRENCIRDPSPFPSLFNLNNQPISYRQTITQFALCHLAARTACLGTRGGFLHTLEYWKASSPRRYEKQQRCDPRRAACVALQHIVYHFACRLSLFPADYNLHLSSTEGRAKTQNRQILLGFFFFFERGWNPSHRKCVAYKRPHIATFFAFIFHY